MNIISQDTLTMAATSTLPHMHPMCASCWWNDELYLGLAQRSTVTWKVCTPAIEQFNIFVSFYPEFRLIIACFINFVRYIILSQMWSAMEIRFNSCDLQAAFCKQNCIFGCKVDFYWYTENFSISSYATWGVFMFGMVNEVLHSKYSLLLLWKYHIMQVYLVKMTKYFITAQFQWFGCSVMPSKWHFVRRKWTL